MTDSSATQPPGWYYAQGDPPGTQRYWDGSQWVGGPQAAQSGDVATGGGYQPAGAVGAAGAPAELGPRVIAWLIDAGIYIAIYIATFVVALIGSAASDSLGTLLGLLANLALLAFSLWNWVYKQGSTGQTIGKAQQNIKLVADSTGQPVGMGMAFVRGLLQSVLWFLCLIPGLLDILWPFWDSERKRLSDKILNFSVVPA